MPIKRLSDRTIVLPRLGKIHLGIIVTKEGRTYPRAVDHFVCPEEVTEVFGPDPKSLRIMIPEEDPERWCAQYYRCYSQSRGLVCKGTGEVCDRLVDTETGDLAGRDTKESEWRQMACKGHDCPDFKRQCREVMNLQFLLPEVPGLGVWQVDTGSFYSMVNINSAADLILRIYGRVSFIPLILALEPIVVTSGPDHSKKTVHVLNIRSDKTLKALMEASANTPASMLLTMGGQGIEETPTPEDAGPAAMPDEQGEGEPIEAEAIVVEPEPIEAAVAEPKVYPIPGADQWRDLWEKVKIDLGLDVSQALGILEVVEPSDWIAKGRTLADAYVVLKAAKREDNVTAGLEPPGETTPEQVIEAPGQEVQPSDKLLRDVIEYTGSEVAAFKWFSNQCRRQITSIDQLTDLQRKHCDMILDHVVTGRNKPEPKDDLPF